MKFEWQEGYRVGNNLIDDQHQHLFALAEELRVTKSPSTLRLGVVRLHNYIKEHFADEEALMRQVAYPGYEGHVSAHKRILARLNVVTQSMDDGDCDQLMMQELMMDWALDHIAFHDIEIAIYVPAPSKQSSEPS